MIRPRVLFLMAIAVSTMVADPRAETADRVVPLPKVRVSAQVPLIKVAEFHLGEARFGAAVVAEGDSLYIIGGGNGDLVTRSVERLDLITGKSTPFARLKTGRVWHGAAIADHKIFVLGGFTQLNGDRPPTDSVEVIDLVTGAVSAGPHLPIGLARFGCLAWEQQVYVMGGVRFKGNYLERDFNPEHGGARERVTRTLLLAYTNAMSVLDVATRRWSGGTPMPFPGGVSAVVVPGPSIVIAGGYDGGKRVSADPGRGTFDDESLVSLEQVVAYNPGDHTWRVQPSLDRRASEHALAALGPYVFLFGGKDRNDEWTAYDLRTKQAETFTSDFRPRSKATAVTHQDLIFVIGGEDPGNLSLDLVQVFALHLPPAK